MQRTRRDWLFLYGKGVAMGAADVVPGVSGGTIAFISGIYEELIHSLKSCDHRAVLTLFREGPRAAWQAVNGNFLAVLLSGIFTSVLLLSKAVVYLLEHQPMLLWSFFFGLILMSAVMIYRQAHDRSLSHHVLLVLGAVIAVAITWFRPMDLEPNLLWFFGSACIAICAMILPGISGSFILLLMGMYPHVMKAISTLDLLPLAVFAAGCGIGLTAFSHVLSWLLRRWHDAMLMFMTGFLFGSLSMIWPWKHATAFYTDRHGQLHPLVQENIWPWDYTAVTGQPALPLACAILILAGIVLMPVLQAWADRLARRQ